MAIFAWRVLDGAFNVASNWANKTFKIDPARVAPGIFDDVTFDIGGGTISGTGSVASIDFRPTPLGWTIVGQLSATRIAVDGSVEIGTGGILRGGSLTITTAAALSAASGGIWRANTLTMTTGSAILGDAKSIAGGGDSLGTAGALTVDPLNKAALSGSVKLNANIVNNGFISESGGTLTVAGNLSGFGEISIGTSSTLALNGTVAEGGTIFFAGIGSTLSIGGPANTAGGVSPSSVLATLTGFNDDDSIILANVSADSVAATLTGNILTLTSNGSVVETLTLDPTAVDYSHATVAVGAANVHDTRLTIAGAASAVSAPPPACYCAGTRIETTKGEVNVEDLVAGDTVLTYFAGEAPVVWVGHREIDCLRHPEPRLVWPVRVAAHAFGVRQPHAELWLSPDHAVFVEGLLIPIKHLINGTTIDQVPVDRVTYYHVETARHDVLFAEGLTAETYLDTGNRALFANGGGALTLHPDFATPRTWNDDGAAPLATDAARVKPVWESLAARARTLGHMLSDHAFTEDPDLAVRVNGRLVRPVVAERTRYVFMLPAYTGPPHLISRSGYPTDARPWADDWRRLGIYIGHISWRDRDSHHDFPVDHPMLDDGWWAVERAGHFLRRWTDGEALLPLPAGAIMLEIRLAGHMTYVADTAGTSPCHADMSRDSRLDRLIA